MIDSPSSVRVTMRIPATWKSPKNLFEGIPAGYRLMPEHLVLPDGTKFELNFLQPDDQFASVFKTSCRRPARPEETEIVNNFKVMVCLTGNGGSLENAMKLMEAAGAIIDAGGGAVFIDNCGLAHGGQMWNEMLADGSTDALSFAFVSIMGGREDMSTMGMHVLGRPDVMMRRGEPHEVADDEEKIIEVLRYLCSTDRDFGNGHIIADEQGPRFRAVPANDDRFEPGSPMYNPWGRFRLISMKEIADNN